MTDLEQARELMMRMTDLELERAAWSVFKGDITSWPKQMADALAAARRQGAEEATLRAENAEATAYAWADADAYRRGAEEMRERAAGLVFYEKSLNGDLDDVADAIRALPLTPEGEA